MKSSHEIDCKNGNLENYEPNLTDDQILQVNFPIKQIEQYDQCVSSFKNFKIINRSSWILQVPLSHVTCGLIFLCCYLLIRSTSEKAHEHDFNQLFTATLASNWKIFDSKMKHEYFICGRCYSCKTESTLFWKRSVKHFKFSLGYIMMVKIATKITIIP